jgi:hypothetical protein
MGYDAPKTCRKGSKAVQAPMDKGQDNYVRPLPGAFIGADRSLDSQPGPPDCLVAARRGGT